MVSRSCASSGSLRIDETDSADDRKVYKHSCEPVQWLSSLAPAAQLADDFAIRPVLCQTTLAPSNLIENHTQSGLKDFRGDPYLMLVI